MYQCQHATVSITPLCVTMHFSLPRQSPGFLCLHGQHDVDWIQNWQQLMAITTTLSFRPAAVDTVNSIKERLLKARNYSVTYPKTHTANTHTVNVTHVLAAYPCPNEATQVILNSFIAPWTWNQWRRWSPCRNHVCGISLYRKLAHRRGFACVGVVAGGNILCGQHTAGVVRRADLHGGLHQAGAQARVRRCATGDIRISHPQGTYLRSLCTFRRGSEMSR